MALGRGSTNGGGAVQGIDPFEVRFSQRTVSIRFRKPFDRQTIDDLAEALRTGQVQPEDVEPIRLVRRGGLLYTLDNRRLEAFRRVGVRVPFRMATPREVRRLQWKFDTENQGASHHSARRIGGW